MAQIIGLPKLSPTMEEGVLVKWAKQVGDKVAPGDLVAEVETDKANMDFNIEDDGTLLKFLVKEGDTVKLGAPVAILGKPGEDIAALNRPGRRRRGSAPVAAPAPAPVAAPAPAPAAAPAAAPAPVAAPAPAPVATSGGKLLASPLAKTLAVELGIDLRTIAGTGPGGRIVERDVRDAASGARPAAAPTASAIAPAAAPAPALEPHPVSDTALATIGPAPGDWIDVPRRSCASGSQRA
jgi:pyruvate dehydrogenase E2 component (dihydrolipoamide acetyltransferase)